MLACSPRTRATSRLYALDKQKQKEITFTIRRAGPERAGESSGTFFLTPELLRSLLSGRKPLISSRPNRIPSMPGDPAEEGKEKGSCKPYFIFIFISNHCAELLSLTFLLKSTHKKLALKLFCCSHLIENSRSG